MKSVINISLDQIAIWHNSKLIRLERNGVDVEIGKALVVLDRECPFQEVLVINGPGGFTNLRVGTLALNLLKTLKGDQISFFSLSKPELFEMAYKKWLLPAMLMMYIGQKSNVRVWDLSRGELVSMVKKTEIRDLRAEYGQIAVDMVYEEGYFEQGDLLSYVFDEEGVILSWNWAELRIPYDELMIHPVDKLEANYMIDPNVG